MNSYIYDLILSHDAEIVGWEDESVCIKHYHGYKHWYKNGLRHRENGPAIEGTYNNKYYYINDQYLTEQEFNQR